MKIVGIDYSYSCPAIVWMNYNPKFDLSNVHCLAIFDDAHKFLKKNPQLVLPVTLKGFNVFNSTIEKFDYLAKMVIDFIPKDSLTFCALEDYSFASNNGRKFTIGENAGILKHTLFEWHMKLRLYAPTFIKRFVKEQNEELAVKCSEGKLKKDGTVRIDTLKKNAMHEIFCWKFNIDLCDYFHMKKYVSPLADIVDALWILYIFWLETKIRVNDINNLTDQEIAFVRNGVDGVGLHTKPFVF
jgi:hypothetical protein